MAENEERQGDSGVGKVPGKPGQRNKRSYGPARMLQSERLKDNAAAIAIVLGALPAVGSLILSLSTVYRGEPVAEKAWITLRDQVNKQSSQINKLHLRVVYFQGRQEGQFAAELQRKLDDLQKKYDDLKESKKVVGAPVQVGDPRSPCRPGRVFAGGKCQAVPRAVTVLVKRKEAEAEAAKLEVMKQAKQRVVEQRKRIKQQVSSSRRNSGGPLLKALPKMLDDAAEKKDD